MKLKKRLIDMYFLIGGILLIVGFLFLVHLPLSAKIKKLREEKERLVENKNSLTVFTQKLASLQLAEADLEQEIQILESSFKAGVIWDIMKKVDVISKKSGLTILYMHPDIVVTSDPYQRDSLDIKFKGDFHSFYHLACFEHY